MKRTLLVTPLLAALVLSLSACSVGSLLPSTTLVGSTPTPAPTAVPTQPPVAGPSTTGFDNWAGNCPDASNQAIALINQAAAGAFGGGSSFTMDMSLDLNPHGPASGCADSPQRIQLHYRQYVSAAHLSIWPLNSAWPNAGPTIREQWLAEVLNALVRLYPQADITISVLYSGSPCGSASIGAGREGTRQINAVC